MNKKFKQMALDIQRRAKLLDRDLRTRATTAVAKEFKACFVESFRMQRFNDTTSPSWAEVERRKPSSPWYKNAKPAARTRAILHGSGSAGLRNSIDYRLRGTRTAVIYSDKPYAEIHNEGGGFLIYGRTRATMPKRQFMGDSKKAQKDGFKALNIIINKDMLA